MLNSMIKVAIRLRFSMPYGLYFKESSVSIIERKEKNNNWIKFDAMVTDRMKGYDRE